MGRKDHFSYDGLGALFDWMEAFEDETATEMEFDCISICCDFSEHDSALDCCHENGYETPDLDGLSDEEANEAALEYLQENTQVIEFEGGIIIQAF